jgi:PAS domain S-box-containing protein
MTGYLNPPWLIHAIVTGLYLVVLIYLAPNRKWNDVLQRRLGLYLCVACIGSAAYVAAYGGWTIDGAQAGLLKIYLYAQAALPLCYYYFGRAFVRLEQKPWGLILGVVLLLLLILIDVTSASIPLPGFTITTAALVMLIRATIYSVYNGLIVTISTQEYIQTTSPLHRNRLLYLALASGFLFVDGALDMIFTLVRPLAIGLQATGISILAYAALRHSLLDLRTLIRRSIYFIILSAITVAVYFIVIEILWSSPGIDSSGRVVSALIAAIALALIYQPVRALLQDAIGRILFGQRYDVQSVVQEFSQRLSARIDLDEFVQEGRTLLKNAMGAHDVLLLVVERDDQGYTLSPLPMRPEVPAVIRLNPNCSVAETLITRAAPLLQYDIDRLPQYSDITPETRAELQKLNGEVYVPIISRGILIGIWVISVKQSGDRYTDDDLTLLSTLAGQSAVALENARLLTDLRQQMSRMRSMRDYLDSIMGSIATGVFTVDREGKIISFNRAAESIFRIPAMNALGKHFDAVLPKLEGAQLPLLFARIWGQSAQNLVRDAVAHVDGRGEVHLSLHLSPMRRGSDLVGVAVVIEDLTEQARLEVERRAQEKETQRVRSTFERYVTPSVVDTLLADPNRVALGGERHLITVLFADIHGFTSLSEKLPPEALVQVLNGYLSIAAQTILYYEGTLDKFYGDGVMALFNVPLQQPDHAWRAASAALTLQREVAKFAMQLPESERLNFRVGLHTGEAVVGNIGAHDLMNYTAIGDTVNIAKRLQENAESGGILMTQSTYNLIRDRVIALPHENLLVKGRSTPIEVFELTGAWGQLDGK